MRLEIWHLFTNEKINEGKLTGWRVVVRIKGYPTASKTFERKQEAEDWGHETERRIKLGQFNFNGHQKQFILRKPKMVGQEVLP